MASDWFFYNPRQIYEKKIILQKKLHTSYSLFQYMAIMRIIL